MPLPIQTSSEPEASVKSLGHHQQTSDKPIANQEDTRAKMVFWVRFVFRALSWRIRGTFYGYGQRDRGYLGQRTHPGGCAGVTVAVSHRSHGTYCQNAVLGRFVFGALSSHVRATFYGYGHHDLGFPTLETHSDRCEGLTFPASATSP